VADEGTGPSANADRGGRPGRGRPGAGRRSGNVGSLKASSNGGAATIAAEAAGSDVAWIAVSFGAGIYLLTAEASRWGRSWHRSLASLLIAFLVRPQGSTRLVGIDRRGYVPVSPNADRRTTSRARCARCVGSIRWRGRACRVREEREKTDRFVPARDRWTTCAARARARPRCSGSMIQLTKGTAPRSGQIRRLGAVGAAHADAPGSYDFAPQSLFPGIGAHRLCVQARRSRSRRRRGTAGCAENMPSSSNARTAWTPAYGRR